ncbi:hypothetical protein HN954_00400 [bacterium]|jgi:pimeloyl-ACP methyl ester carboxylesterase|nr:hypothetical protein [bacterium]MBT6832093.1 hypothetical protein [bacterium]MBT6995874.1 hypothetical protein [bacterium]MBT7772601.1 hypothetical protein [bacterium]
MSKNLVIGQGLGSQQPWSHDLAREFENRGIFTWNEKMPDAEFPTSETAGKWSAIFQKIFTPETTAFVHSASAISAIDALRNAELQNLIFLAGWCADPGQKLDPWGKTVRKIFTRNGEYFLAPFLELLKKHAPDWQHLKNSVHGKICIVFSADDPYVHLSEAEFFHKKFPGSELLKIENAGHFEFRPGNKNRAAKNEKLPEILRQKILEIV